MREVRKRGMRAVEIEAAEKCGQCRKVPFSLLGSPVYLLQFCSESHVSTSVTSWPLNRSDPLVNRGWSAHRLNSLTLTPERMARVAPHRLQDKPLQNIAYLVLPEGFRQFTTIRHFRAQVDVIPRR